MTLVDRYLRAVRDHLPRGQQDDIINELSDSLHSRLEDEAAARGRPLLEAEESAILKEFGHPMTVAARYRADERSVTFGRRLIGPELFPTYMQVLAVNVAITLLIAAITAIASVSIWPGVVGILIPLAIQFTIVTGIFVIIDRNSSPIPTPGTRGPSTRWARTSTSRRSTGSRNSSSARPTPGSSR